MVKNLKLYTQQKLPLDMKKTGRGMSLPFFLNSYLEHQQTCIIKSVGNFSLGFLFREANTCS